MEAILRQINQGIVPLDAHITDFQRNWWIEFNLDFLNREDQNTEEIILHGDGRSYRKTSRGQQLFQLPLETQWLQSALELLALKNEASWNYTNPFVSFYSCFAGQSVRVSLIHHSCSPQKCSHAYFRFLGQQVRPIEDFCQNQFQKQIVTELVEQKKNVLVCGATGSGKTSLLSTVLGQFQADEHLLLVEDTAELVCHHPHLTRLLAQSGGHKSMQSYLTYGMRMSPDRIVLGELRSMETIAFLMALNSGHRGCWSTIHANGPLDAIDRLCLLFNLYNEKHLPNEYVMKLACQALDAIIFIENKKIQRITRIINVNNAKVIHQDIIE